MAPMIGEFDVDPETIEEAQLPAADQPFTLEVEKAERKLAPTSGNNFISLTFKLVEIPSAKVFNSYFLTAKALSSRSSAVSYKKFLERVKLPFTTTAQELVNFRFIAKLKHEGKGEDAQARLAEIVGPVEG